MIKLFNTRSILVRFFVFVTFKTYNIGYVYSAGTGNSKIILIVPVMHCACSDQAWLDVEASSGNPQVVLDEFVYK